MGWALEHTSGYNVWVFNGANFLLHVVCGRQYFPQFHQRGKRGKSDDHKQNQRC